MVGTDGRSEVPDPSVLDDLSANNTSERAAAKLEVPLTPPSAATASTPGILGPSDISGRTSTTGLECHPDCVESEVFLGARDESSVGALVDNPPVLSEDTFGFSNLFKSARSLETDDASRLKEHEDCASPPTPHTPFTPTGEEGGAKVVEAKPPTSPISPPPRGMGCMRVWVVRV